MFSVSTTSDSTTDKGSGRFTHLYIRYGCSTGYRYCIHRLYNESVKLRICIKKISYQLHDLDMPQIYSYILEPVDYCTCRNHTDWQTQQY